MSEKQTTEPEATNPEEIIAVPKHVNPLLAKVSLPGETFRLPSGGLFYKNNELSSSVKDGEVMVNPMTAMDELLLKSPDKLLSGESVTDVFTNCLPDVLNPSEILAKDVDYLLMCLRMVSYGPNIEIRATHDCEDAKEHSYSIPLRPLILKAKSINPTTLEKYNVTLSNGQVVELHPPKFIATVKVYQMFSSTDENIDTQEIGLKLIETISDMVSSVDGHTERSDIQEWLQQVRVGDVKLISDKVTDLSDWGVDPTATVTCKDCEKDQELVVPINPVSFFI